MSLRGKIFTTAEALPAVADDLPLEQLRRLMLKAISLPLGMMLLVCVLLGWQVVVLVEEGEQVARSQAIIGETYRAQKLLLDHETALRGFMLTGEDVFLAPFRHGRTHLPDTMQRLRGLLAGDARQRTRLDELGAKYELWLSTIDWDHAAAQVRDAELLRQLEDRKAQMDAIRRLVGEVIADETHLLAQRERQAGRRTRVTLAGGAALLLALGVFMGTSLRRWIRRMEGTYAKALARRRQSEMSERGARQAAEALAAEVTAQSRELEARLRAMRRELEAARAAARPG